MSPLRSRVLAAVATGVALAASLSACSGDDGAKTETGPSVRPSPTVAPPPAPPEGACYDLAYDAALAPTSTAAPVDCAARHTAETVAIGRVEAVVDGHLLAIDSAHVQRQVATACPAALARFVGDKGDALRLSMIRPVWFTPTVEQSDAGADWFRCDAVVLARNSALVPLTGSLRGVLAKGRTPDRLAMCGTAAPDAQDFQRVPCSVKHSWRAIAVVPFKAGDYPGESTVRAAGRGRCEDAAADRAADPLAFEWGYEWPTAEQWKAGQDFGRCWSRD